MRILIICYVYPPEVAPAGVMVSELAEDLSRRGHRVTVLTGWPNHPLGKLFDGFRMRWRSVQREGGHRLMRVAHATRAKSSPISRLWVYVTFAVSSFLNAVTLGRHEVVVCLSTPLTGVWTALAVAKLWRGRFVNVIFDLWPEAIRNAGLIGDSKAYRLIRMIDTWNCRLSDAITTLGEGMKSQILARGIPAEKVTVLPFWIDTLKIHPLDRLNAWRREQGIGPDKFVALFAGTIGYASGAQILAETAATLTDRKDILLLIVGEGVVKQELERLARDRRLANMRFLPFQPAERLAEVQSAADVGLVTLLPQSGISSVPSKVLGYMAAARPVIASASADTDTARLIRQADCGLATEARDPHALARAIAELADDPARRRQMGQRALRHLTMFFSRQAIIGCYERIIAGGSLPMPTQTQGQRQVAVVPAEPCHLRGMAECHIACFPDQFMPHVGPNFTVGFFRAYLDDPQGLAFVAVDEATGKVVGSVVGGRPAIRREFLASAPRRYPWALLARMVADQVVRAKLLGEMARRLGVRGKKGMTEPFDSESWHPKDRWAILDAISLLPEARGTGVSDALLGAMVDSCARAGYSSICLSVYSANLRGVAFYRRNGWKVVEDHGDTMIMGWALGSEPSPDRQDAGHGNS